MTPVISFLKSKHPEYSKTKLNNRRSKYSVMVNFKLLTILTITTTSLMKIKAYKLASSIIMTTFWEICSIKIKVNKITSSIKISIYKMANLVYPKLCRLASWMKNKIFKDLNLMTIKVSRIVSSDILFYILTFIYDD